MMNSCLLNTFVENEVLKSTCDFIPERVMNGDVFYEVLKVEKGIPFFLEKHLFRFKRSLSLAQIKIPSEDMIRLSLRTLIESNKLQQGNIRFQVTLNNENKSFWYCWVSPHQYPTQKQYDEGIRTGVFQSERLHPEIKHWNTDFKIRANAFLKRTHHYEALLLNSHGQITEGSRSNVFFITKSQIITPESYLILPGVTRSVVIDLAKNLGIQINEAKIMTSLLSEIDSAFITGTSKGVLPIQSIDAHKLNTKNTILNRLQTEYRLQCTHYIDHFKW